MRARAVVVVTLALAACGARSRESTLPVSTSSGEAPWVLVPRVAASAPIEPVREGDGWVGAAGRLRYRLDAGGRIEEASQVVDSPIVAVMHAPEAWVFLTHAGEVLRAEEPLGSLTPVGTLGGHRVEVVVSSERRIAVLDERSRLFLVDAEGARQVGEVPVTDASFATASFGIRMDLGGELFSTSDGGLHWSALASPFSQPPRVLYHRGSTLYLGTDENERASLAEDGTVTRLDAPPAAEPGAPDDVEARVRAHFLRRGPASPVAADGRLWVWTEGGVRLASGGDVLPLAPDCRIATWGARLVARCEGGAFVSDGSSPFEAMDVLGEAELDPAGDRYLVRGACEDDRSVGDDEEESSEDEYDEYDESEDEDDGGDRDEHDEHEDAARAFCVHDESTGAVRTLAMPEDCRGAVQGIGLGRAVVVVDCGRRRRLTTMDLGTGEIADVPLPEGAIPWSARVAVDGTLVVNALDGMGRGAPGWLVGTLAGALVTMPVPEQTRMVVPLDARHLVARDDAHRIPRPGETSGAILLSDDGGAHFHPIERDALAAFGARADVSGAWIDERTVMGASSIDLGGWIWMRPGVEGVTVPASIGVEGAAQALPETSVAVSVDLRTEPRRSYLGHPSVPSPAALQGDHVLVAGGWARFDQDHVSRGLAGPVEVEVGGEDDAGAFHWRTRAAVPPPPTGSTEQGQFTHALGVSRALVALLRCVEVDDAQTCEVLVVRANGQVGTSPRSRFDWSTETRGVLTGADGSLVVHFSSARSDTEDETGHHIDSVLQIAPDGTVTRRVLHTGPVASSRVLARDGSGTVGLLVARRDEARFVTLDGRVGPALPAPSGRVTTLCGAPVAAAIDTVRRGRILSGFWIDADIVVSVAPDASMCVRSAVTRDQHEMAARNGRGAVVARVDGGHLSCALLAVDGTRLPLSCEVAPTGETLVAPASPSDRPLLARLADGTLAVALRRRHDEYRTLTLGAAGWVEAGSIRWTSEQEYPRPHPVLVQGAETPTLFLRGEATRLVSSSGVAPLAVEARVVRGPASARELVEATDRALTHRRADGQLGAPLTLPLSVLRLRDAGAGLYAITLCPPHDVDDESYASSACERRVLGLRGETLGLSGPLGGSEVGEPRWSDSFVLGGDAAHPLALVFAEDRDSHRTLMAVRADGARVTPIGPPIAPSNHPTARILPLAIFGAPTRVAYVDDACTSGPDLCDVRVVTLRGRQWYDVAAPWHVDSEAVAAIVDGNDLVVVGVTATGRMRSARLHDGAWVQLSAPEAAPLEPEDEVEE
ncbi:MAG: hypothetical protein K1X94_05840 [Sandaracinaceae bacterium]|nr:hypothetical protein [Sandaracinaceae bacterium]